MLRKSVEKCAAKLGNTPVATGVACVLDFYVRLARKKSLPRYTCVECGKTRCKDRDKMFVGVDWCKQCYEVENTRNKTQDYLGNYMFKRPPRYLLDLARRQIEYPEDFV